MKLVLIILLFSSTAVLGNVNNFTIKLDEFTLATSQLGLNDTIDVTQSAWESSDSLHLSLYICGNNFDGAKCRVLARDDHKKLFEMFFTNSGVAMQFSISTSRINLNVVRFVALTMGLSPQDNRHGLNYRMGFLRFI